MKRKSEDYQIIEDFTWLDIWQSMGDGKTIQTIFTPIQMKQLDISTRVSS